nr:MBL fold hydrolase [Mammaliicoccus sciuri]
MLVISSALIACSNTTKSSGKNKDLDEKEIKYKLIKGEDVNYYVMPSDPIMGSASTIIEKNGKGLLIDTQFSNKDGKNIVKLAKEKSIDIEKIYISYSDPDFYFGTDIIKQNYPKAEVVATNETIKRIKNTHNKKIEIWKETLKKDTPSKIIIPKLISGNINFEEEKFDIIGSNSKKQTLYNKKDNLLVGGILTSTGSHLFMADTKDISSQKEWINNLNELERINPDVVIPGHFNKKDQFNKESIKFTKQYIEDFIDAENTSDTSKEIIKKMKDKYPELSEGSIKMSAKVVTGEQKWE